MVDISIVNGIINQLITGGHHLVSPTAFQVMFKIPKDGHVPSPAVSSDAEIFAGDFHHQQRTL